MIETSKKIEYLYDKINYNQWEILEYIHWNSHNKNPTEVNVRIFSNHLDMEENKVRKLIIDLKNKKILTQKQLKISKKGFKVKKSFERKYDDMLP